MKFVTDHFTKHHLFHKPHKWFLALLVSPIHTAEMHYKKKYHLKFGHAKKLFMFDMSLLLSVIILIIATTTWMLYDPTITGLVSLKITTSENKIQSGEQITYTIEYKNKSDIPLTNSILSIDPTQEFIYSDKNTSIQLGTINPGESNKYTIHGYFYATPNKETKLNVALSYIQQERTTTEVKRASLITIARESTLKTSIKTDTTIIGQGSSPIEITLTNTGEQTLYNVTLPLPNNEQFSIKTDTSLSTITIEKLEPNETKSFINTLTTNINPPQKSLELSFTPNIEIKNSAINQKTEILKINVVHPDISIQTLWKDNLQAKPNTSKTLQITMTNKGDITLDNLELSINLPSTIIDKIATKNKNQAKLNGNILIINKDFHPAFSSLPPNKTITIPVEIPILYNPSGGTDLTISLVPIIKANPQEIPNSTFQKSVETQTINIGTQLISEATLRYYTPEGDQLGRGPLPPNVGRETKYWALINLKNTTSKIENITITANLPSYVVWTGKSSVSHGNDVSYNNSTRQITWHASKLYPHEKGGVYFELSLTPNNSQIGQNPIMLTNIHITAKDNYIGQQINQNLPNLDISLPNDTIGKQRGGTTIQ